MAHESFEDDEVAAAMNAGFVCIKVDREERPDIDAVYMNATVALTGQGGWPMTCFLTPDGRPFFCGTYYPKAGFLQLLSAVSVRGGTVATRSSRRPTRSRANCGRWRPVCLTAARGSTAALCDHAVAAVLRDEDTARGGFGGAPKFPPSALLEALLRNYERTGSSQALAAVQRTGTAMARGGIYDQLAGGFARYSVDNAWVVPHFEKMLYDNALLLRGYAHWARRTGDPLARRVDRRDGEVSCSTSWRHDGMFTSSLDADADGREGSTYVWTPARTDRSARRRRRPLGRFGFRGHRRRHVRRRRIGAAAARDPDDPDRFERVRAALLAARLTRPQPGRDDKVVTAWNGLAITALAEASVALAAPEFADAAADARTRCCACTSWTGGCAGPASAGGSAKARRSWRITRCWPPGC